jgi:hypothetical protein
MRGYRDYAPALSLQICEWAFRLLAKGLHLESETVANLRSIEGLGLPDSFGDEVRLGDLWAERPAIVVWLRHYG